MTGPEHFRTAELLLADVSPDGSTRPEADVSSRWHASAIARAQAHATLALAAATALAVNPEALTTGRYEQWVEVAGTP